MGRVIVRAAGERQGPALVAYRWAAPPPQDKRWPPSAARLPPCRTRWARWQRHCPAAQWGVRAASGAAWALRRRLLAGDGRSCKRRTGSKQRAQGAGKCRQSGWQAGQGEGGGQAVQGRRRQGRVERAAPALRGGRSRNGAAWLAAVQRMRRPMSPGAPPAAAPGRSPALTGHRGQAAGGGERRPLAPSPSAAAALLAAASSLASPPPYRSAPPAPLTAPRMRLALLRAWPAALGALPPSLSLPPPPRAAPRLQIAALSRPRCRALLLLGARRKPGRRPPQLLLTAHRSPLARRAAAGPRQPSSTVP